MKKTTEKKKKEETKEALPTKLEEGTRLVLQNLALKISAMNGRLESYRHRKNFLMLEMQVLEGKIPEAEKEKAKLTKDLNVALSEVLEQMGLPPDTKVSLETGEVHISG